MDGYRRALQTIGGAGMLMILRVFSQRQASRNRGDRGEKEMSRPTLALAILACVTATTTRVAAQVLVPPSPQPVTSTVVTVNNGPGEQTDPHVSGDLVSYTDGAITTRTIRYYRFSAGVDAPIPSETGFSDFLSDVSSDRIAFTRVVPDRTAIIVFETAASTLTEIDPQVGSMRIGSAIGGNSVAYIDFATGAGVVFAHDLSSPGPGFGTVQLSAGSGTAQNPNVAPSGHVVVWEQCQSSILNCDVIASVFKPDQNAWSGFVVAAGAINPDTDGTWVVYDANRAGSLTGQDIYLKPVAGDGIERQLAIAGSQVNPSISQGVIVFESRATLGSPGDILVYVIATNTLYQITSTVAVDDTLSDVDVLSNGDIRVVWAANDGLMGDYNVYATTFTPAGGVHYEICLLYDPLVARRSGAVYPIKVQLCDASGQDLSSPDIVLHAESVTQTSTNAPGPLDDAGNANPDNDFRYEAELGGYIFNLSLRGIPTGSYNLNFRAGADPALHSAPFAVR